MLQAGAVKGLIGSVDASLLGPPLNDFKPITPVVVVSRFHRPESMPLSVGFILQTEGWDLDFFKMGWSSKVSTRSGDSLRAFLRLCRKLIWHVICNAINSAYYCVHMCIYAWEGELEGGLGVGGLQITECCF